MRRCVQAPRTFSPTRALSEREVEMGDMADMRDRSKISICLDIVSSFLMVDD